MSTTLQENFRYPPNWYYYTRSTFEYVTCVIDCLLPLFQIYDFTAEDLEDMGEIGRGNFGSVNKMLHIKTNTVMAVKVYMIN